MKRKTKTFIPPVPTYMLKLRHPKYGWVVIGIYDNKRYLMANFGYIRDSATHDYNPFQVTAYKLVGHQIWNVLAHHDGGYKYEYNF